jgi:trypsin
MNSNSCLKLPDRRLLTLLAVCIGALASVFAISSSAFASSGNGFEASNSLVPQIINGQESSISQFPWQVFVLTEEGEGATGSCGGSILNATTILTAAHCVNHEETKTPYPVEDFLVIAGASEVLLATEEAHPPSHQVVGVKSIRSDPYYAPLSKTNPGTTDDVAVLTLAEPLELSSAKNTAAIGLVPTGATPAPGTPLSVSGYGKEEGAEGAPHNPNGKLYSASLTAISTDACRGLVGEVNSAVFLCAESSSSATCQGDSGGPLTEGSPAVQVGTVDVGPKECPAGQPDGFMNLAAPEIRDFIEGSESPPIAARPTSPPVIKSVGAAPVDFSPLTCEPGAWNGSPTFSYSFQIENASAQLFQSGPGNIFIPPSSLVGSPLVCIVQASNPGGVTTVRSATSAAIAADTAVPTSSITAVKCVKQACTLSIAASDPNAVALAVQSSAAYSLVAKCPKKKKKKKGKKPVKQPVCHKTKTVPMSLVNSSAGAYTASASGLPYGEKIAFSVAASNAAGLKAALAVRSTTLHKPKPKPKKKPKKKARKGR